MKFIWTCITYLFVDVVAVAIGFGLVYPINPFYTGDITWLYLGGLVAGLVAWFAGHAVLDVITKK